MVEGRFQSEIGAAQKAQGQVASADLGDVRAGNAQAAGAKAEASQRLQIGLFGLGSMVLLIGLATIIGRQADLTQESAVPEAAPTTEPVETSQQTDPLAQAGIVPDIPLEAEPEQVEGVVEDLPDAVTDEARDLPSIEGEAQE